MKKQISARSANESMYHKVKGHYLHTGKYRGAAYNIFNVEYSVPKEVPVVFHNGSIYDYYSYI